MTHDDRLLRRLADANPAPPEVDLPLDTSPADLLTELHERLAPAPPPTRPPAARRWRGPAYAVAVFLLVLAAGAALRLALPAAAPKVTATIPAETVATPAPTAPPTTVAPTTAPPTTVPPTTRAPTTTAAVPGGLDVHIDTEIVPVLDEWPGPFTMTGPAVDAGIVCPAGERSLLEKDFGMGTWRSTVLFTCDDGSGTFELAYDLAISYGDDGYTESGTWLVTWGDGAYEDLVGWGTDHTTTTEPNHYVSVGLGAFAIDDG